jgi:hypothetical protein
MPIRASACNRGDASNSSPSTGARLVRPGRAESLDPLATEKTAGGIAFDPPLTSSNCQRAKRL